MDFSLLGFGAVKEYFNVHPLFVHFPVALYPCALVFYGLGILLKKSPVLFAGRLSLYFALLGTALALATGLRAEDSIPHNAIIHHLMKTHEFIGWVLLGTSALLAIWSVWQQNHLPKAHWGFLAVLIFASYLVSQTADIGGRMVYLEGAGVKPAVSAIAEKNFATGHHGSEEAGEPHHHHHDE